MKSLQIDISEKTTKPAYLVLLDYEIRPARTLEEAIDFADTHFEICEIYKRNGTTGPLFYKYLCNVYKDKSTLTF